MAQPEIRRRGGEDVWFTRVFYNGKKKAVGEHYYPIDEEKRAKQAIERAERRIKAGLSPWGDDDGTPIFREFVDKEYWVSLNSSLKKSTTDDYRQTLKCVLDDERYSSVTFADKTVRSITHIDINKFLQDFLVAHSGNYQHKMATRIYQVMGMAGRKYHFINPMDDPDFTKPIMPNRSRVQLTMTKEETNRIVKATLEHGDLLWTWMITTMLITGVRRSELLGMTTDCLRMEDGNASVYIYQQWDWETKTLVPNTKSNHGQRFIPIDEDVYRGLLKWVNTHRRKNPKNDVLFPPPKGEVWTSESVWSRAYNVRLKWAGITPSRKKSSQQLRHLFAVTSLRNHVPIDVLSHQLGHADNSFTLDRYIHVIQELDRRGTTARTEALVPAVLREQPYQRNIF